MRIRIGHPTTQFCKTTLLCINFTRTVSSVFKWDSLLTENSFHILPLYSLEELPDQRLWLVVARHCWPILQQRLGWNDLFAFAPNKSTSTNTLQFRWMSKKCCWLYLPFHSVMLNSMSSLTIFIYSTVLDPIALFSDNSLILNSSLQEYKNLIFCIIISIVRCHLIDGVFRCFLTVFPKGIIYLWEHFFWFL